MAGAEVTYRWGGADPIAAGHWRWSGEASGRGGDGRAVHGRAGVGASLVLAAGGHVGRPRRSLRWRRPAAGRRGRASAASSRPRPSPRTPGRRAPGGRRAGLRPRGPGVRPDRLPGRGRGPGQGVCPRGHLGPGAPDDPPARAARHLWHRHGEHRRVAVPGRAAGDPQLPGLRRSGPAAGQPRRGGRIDRGQRHQRQRLRLGRRGSRRPGPADPRAPPPLAAVDRCARWSVRRPLRRPGGPPEGRPDGSLPGGEGVVAAEQINRSRSSPFGIVAVSALAPVDFAGPGAPRRGPPGRPAATATETSATSRGRRTTTTAATRWPATRPPSRRPSSTGPTTTSSTPCGRPVPAPSTMPGSSATWGRRRRGRGVPRRARVAWTPRASGRRGHDHGRVPASLRARRGGPGRLRQRRRALPGLVGCGPVVGGLPRRTPPRRGSVGRRERRPHRSPRRPGAGEGGQPGPGLRRGCGRSPSGVRATARSAAVPGPGPHGGHQHDRRARRGLDPGHRSVTAGLDPGGTDLSAYDGLRFRLALPPDGRNDRRDRQDLSVRLTDTAGAQAAAAVAGATNAVAARPTSSVVHTVLNGVRLPLSAFGGVDLTRVARVELLFDRTTSGRVLVNDLAFTAEGTGDAVGPTQGAVTVPTPPRQCGQGTVQAWACSVGAVAWGREPAEGPELAGIAFTVVSPSLRRARIAQIVGGPTAARPVVGRIGQLLLEDGWTEQRYADALRFGRGRWEDAITVLAQDWRCATSAETQATQGLVDAVYLALVGRLPDGRPGPTGPARSPPAAPTGWPGRCSPARAGRAGGRRALRPDRRSEPRRLGPGVLGGRRPHRRRRAAPGDRAPRLARARRPQPEVGRGRRSRAPRGGAQAETATGTPRGRPTCSTMRTTTSSGTRMQPWLTLRPIEEASAVPWTPMRPSPPANSSRVENPDSP